MNTIIMMIILMITFFFLPRLVTRQKTISTMKGPPILRPSCPDDDGDDGDAAAADGDGNDVDYDDGDDSVVDDDDRYPVPSFFLSLSL